MFLFGREKTRNQFGCETKNGRHIYFDKFAMNQKPATVPSYTEYEMFNAQGYCILLSTRQYLITFRQKGEKAKHLRTTIYQQMRYTIHIDIYISTVSFVFLFGFALIFLHFYIVV